MALAVTAIHPGEHLAEELHELGMSAAELARKLDVPTNRIYGDLERTTFSDWGYGFAAGAFFWDNCAILDQSSKCL
jgi:hypothetical protein